MRSLVVICHPDPTSFIAAVGQRVIEALRARGHKLRVQASWDGNIARSQMIASAADGGLAVASDLRGEGVALAG